MSLKKYGFATLLIACGSIPFYSSSVSAESQREILKKVSPLMKKMALDLIAIDGIVGEEKEMLENMGGDAKELTNEERLQLAKKMVEILTPKKALGTKEQKEATKGKAIMIGSLFTILGRDGQESSSELAALDVYRSVFVPDTSLDQCRAIALNQMQTMQNKSKRAELVWNLKGIKTAQIAYESEYDVYVPASLYPPLGSDLKTWVVDKSGGFKTISWYPDGQVRGSYKVELNGSTDFKAIGVIDADGDGVYATYVATKSVNPNDPITPPDVY